MANLPRKLVGGWQRNNSRHSHGGYRAAITKDLPAPAIEMGTRYVMIEKHYREAVLEATAGQFWGLTPSKVIRK